MAWIKMRNNLWDDPRVGRLVDLTGSTEAHVIGALYWLWATADQHSVDGVMPGLSVRTIDRKTGVAGLGDALVAIGWMEEHQDGMVIVRFGDHNGESAKKRAVTAKRVANHRAKAAVTHETLPIEHGTVTGALAREREEKEKKQNKGADGGGVLPASDPVDNFSPLAAAAISKNLETWETARGKKPKPVADTDPKLVELAARKVTLDELCSAYELAVKARDRARDLMPVNARFVSLFVDELRAIPPATAPPPPTAWDKTASSIERKAAELGIEKQPEESIPALAARCRVEIDRMECAA